MNISTSCIAAKATVLPALSFNGVAQADAQPIKLGLAAPVIGAQDQCGKDFQSGVPLNQFSYDGYGDRRDAIIAVYKCENGLWTPVKVLGTH